MSDQQPGQTETENYDRLIILAVGASNNGHFDGVAEMAAQAAAIDSARPEAIALMGVIALVSDDFGRAIEFLNRAHEIDPDDGKVCDLLSQVHSRVGNLNDSVYFAKLAGIGRGGSLLNGLRLKDLTGLEDALANAGTKSYLTDARLAIGERRFDDAVDFCDRELRLHGSSAECLQLMGQAMLGRGQTERALDSLMAAVHLDPEDPATHLQIGVALGRLGQRDRAIQAFERAWRLHDDDTELAVRIIAEAAEVDPDGDICERSVTWTGMARKSARMSTLDRGGLRIGYLTDAACNIEEMRILESLLHGHSREDAQIYVFSADVEGDPTASRLMSYATSWHDIRDFEDSTVVDWVGINRLAALVDLTFTCEGQRPAVLSSNPAAKVLGMLGPKPGVLGQGYTDILCQRDETGHEKRAVGVDAPLIAIDPATMPKVGDESPAKENGFVTFGAIADPRYLTPETAKLFSDVLRAVPDSRLRLSDVKPIPESVRDLLMQYFADNGVVNRVDIPDDDTSGQKTLVVRRLEHMVRVDVYLESFPRTPLLVALDAVWAGVPVVAMDGRAFDGMTTPGVLRASGLDDWVAKTAEDYVAKAEAHSQQALDLDDRKNQIKDFQAFDMFDVRKNAMAIEEAIKSS